jgi:hypothetical protein
MYGDESHRQAYIARIRSRIGLRPGGAVIDWGLQRELEFYAQWDPRAREGLAEPWRPPAITTRAALAPTTGPVEHLKTRRLRQDTPAADDWTPPAIALQRR